MARSRTTFKKGHIVSTQTKERISEQTRLAMANPETKRKMSQAKKGKSNPVFSQQLKVLWQIPEFRQKVLTKEHNQHISESRQGHLVSKETREKIARKLAGRKNPEHSYRMRQRWQNLSDRQKQSHIDNIMRACALKPNKLEQQLIALITNYKLPYKYVGDGQFILGGKCPDFLNIDGRKQLIELFGEFWHKVFDVAERTEHFRQYGFSTLVIWESELEDTDKLARKIRKFAVAKGA